MSLKSFKPTTPSNRYKVLPAFDEITKSKPEKSLLSPLRKSGGRNNNGRITTRHIGGGHKQHYRLVDFRRTKTEPATVLAIEYDPNRTCRIALVQYTDGTKSYILAPVGLTVGMTVQAGENVAPKVGNAMPLKSVPLGTAIHNIEVRPGTGGKIARSAGQQAVLSNRDGEYALVKMPSGEMRLVSVKCRATVGQVGNLEHEIVHLGKAGKTRYLGVRPTVRGSVMNPNDHPHGGGEGKSPVGHAGPMTPWGKPALGYKTRKKKNTSSKYILKRIN